MPRNSPWRRPLQAESDIKVKRMEGPMGHRRKRGLQPHRVRQGGWAEGVGGKSVWR